MRSSFLRSDRAMFRYSFHHATCHHHKQPRFPDKNAILTNSALYSAPRRDDLLRHTVNGDAEEFMNFKRTLCWLFRHRQRNSIVLLNEKYGNFRTVIFLLQNLQQKEINWNFFKIVEDFIMEEFDELLYCLIFNFQILTI